MYTAQATDLTFLIPYLAQFALAIICVSAIQSLKLYDRFPWLTNYSDKANVAASVLMALLIAAAFNYKALISGYGTGKDWLWATKDFGVQWALQEGVYRVGVKNSITTLLKMAGLGPKDPPSPQPPNPSEETKTKAAGQ